MLSRKSRGSGAVLAYRGHSDRERNGLVVSTLTTQRTFGGARCRVLMAEVCPALTGQAWSRQGL